MTRSVRFGICTDQNMPWAKTVDRWRLFEQLGFDSAWNCDHMVQPSRPQGPYFEAWTLLAALAAVTSTIRVGVLVTSNTFRHPALLAKEAITVDHISNGRLDIGIGAGWYEPEHRMFGIEFPETKELVSRFKESVEVVDALLRNETASYAGKYYQLREANSRPAPIQKPRPPFTLGAFGPRMLKIAAIHADTWNAFGDVGEIRERNLLLDQYCTEIGRSPDSLGRSLYGWAQNADTDPWQSLDAFEDVVGRYLEAGMNEFILDQPRDEQIGVMEKAASGAIPRLRGVGAPDRVRTSDLPVSQGNWHRPEDYL
jgi:alkanesulfonate monooxygenase SsuD/methylene tetrahydromethanopterin reductase-like flavin-dependent oxidoreductase (luciferase family)